MFKVGRQSREGRGPVSVDRAAFDSHAAELLCPAAACRMPHLDQNGCGPDSPAAHRAPRSLRDPAWRAAQCNGLKHRPEAPRARSLQDLGAGAGAPQPARLDAACAGAAVSLGALHGRPVALWALPLARSGQAAAAAKAPAGLQAEAAQQCGSCGRPQAGAAPLLGAAAALARLPPAGLARLLGACPEAGALVYALPAVRALSRTYGKQLGELEGSAVGSGAPGAGSCSARPVACVCQAAHRRVLLARRAEW